MRSIEWHIPECLLIKLFYVNRRNFIGLSGGASAGLLSTSLEGIVKAPETHTTPAKNFELLLLATDWGFKGTIDEYCFAARKEGYDGIEAWWPLEKKGRDDLFAALKKHGLQVGFLCGGYQPDFRQHLEHFKKMTDAAAGNKLQRPLYINCHSGRDYYSSEQNQEFIDHTHLLAKSSEILICHETHRSRILFAAHVSRTFIEKNPSLRLTLDISHWCNVHESLLKDQEENVLTALERTEHIHARIGHEQCAQVNDPRAPEWKAAVDAHFNWWDKVVQRKKETGGRLTILTEFGPPTYMQTLPFTKQVVADQWDINRYMMTILRKRYL